MIAPKDHDHRPGPPVPRLIAWETTRACPLACKHCRATAQATAGLDELTTDEGLRLLEGIAAFAKPTIILTGGEPMLRPDIYRLAARARELGLNPVMAPCGLLLNEESARRVVEAGVKHISLSLDGATAATHDAFRGVPGAFDSVLRAIDVAKKVGLAFQINTTVTRHNLHELPAILELSTRLGASIFNPFLLVPTGRGRLIANQAIEPQQYEETLEWLAAQQEAGVPIRVTCAPHYQRILRKKGRADLAGRAVGGCLGGKAFAFVSATGKVQICGFMDAECGDLRRDNFDFRKIWETSPIFLQLRNADHLGGKCGACEFRRVCGGCRARAFALTGDYLAEEPFCVYQPASPSSCHAPTGQAELDDLDRRILNLVQADLPVTARPYHELAESLGVEQEVVLSRLAAMRKAKVLRRLGPVFDAQGLHYVSTLVGAQVPPDRLAAVAEEVSRLPQVSHNYARRHDYNLWFTLTAPSQEEIDRLLADLQQAHPEATFQNFPALAMYKRQVIFHLGSGVATAGPGSFAKASDVELTDADKQLIRLLQDDLPLVDEPFADMARELGWSVDQVLEKIHTWLAQGVIRRFGAVVGHRQLGFAANGMAAFVVPSDQADTVGRYLAGFPQVSHCYLRPPAPGWPYTLFAMIHGECEDEVAEFARGAAAEMFIREYNVLFSVTEFKKVSNRYFAERT